MLPDPIHPLIVHFPLVLASLLPLAALGALLAGRRRGLLRPSWLVVVGLAAGLAGSAWLAVETGEREEERVEAVLSSEAPLSRHESRADQFLVSAIVVLVVSLFGLAPGRVGSLGRAAATVASLVLIPVGIRVGHSGGELVYVHGAAQAYLGGRAASSGPGGREVGEFTNREGDRH
jgi:uncharacterized membrane protein